MCAKKLTDSDYARLSDFRYGLRLYLDFSKSAALAEGLQPQQHQALLTLRGADTTHCTISFLAERLCIRHNTAVELAKRLELAGLIDRRSSESDGRVTCLTLTKLGNQKIQKLTEIHRVELKRFRPEIAAILKNLESVEKP